MANLTLKTIGGLGESSNTLVEYDRIVAEHCIQDRFEAISKLALKHKKCSCFLVGMGGLSKSSYEFIKSQYDSSLVWNGSLLPRALRIFSALIASEAGVVKIENSDEIPEIFRLMTTQTMAGLYIFPSDYESKFIDISTRNPLSERSDFGIKKFRNYFFYLLDTDNSESATGIYEVISYGKDFKYGNEIDLEPLGSDLDLTQ